MSRDTCGTCRTASRTLTHVLSHHLGSIRTAFARRRAMRELDALPYDIRKDIGWRSDL